MIKNFLILLMVVFSVNGAKYHTDSRGAEIHTPFRWIVADSTARMALSVNAVDTQKFCFQLADTTIWCLIDNSPKNWAWVSGKKVDSLYMRTFQAVTAGISGGLRLGSGDFLSVYDTGSFACTTKVGEGFTVQKIGRIRYTIIGDVVTMEIDSQFIGTSNSNFWLLRTGMPIHLMPTKETYSPIGMVMDNGVYVAASACMYSITDAVNDSLIMIIPTGGNGAFTSPGTKGFNGQHSNAKTCWTYKK